MSHKSSGESPAGGCLALVVESDDNVRNLIGRLLTRAGYAVVSARTATDAMSVCECLSRDVRLLIVEVQLADMSAIELYTVLKEKHPNLEPVFILSYKPDADVAPYATGAILGRPFRPRDLLQAIERIFSRETRSGNLQ